MHDFIERNKRMLQIILAVLIVPPFALFGVDQYFSGGGGGDQLAQVGGTSIGEREFGEALRQRQDQMREMMGGKVEQSMLESPEMRRAVLDHLIEERLMYSAALKSGMSVPAAELQTVIGDIPAFKDGNGKFSSRRYKELLSAQGQTEGMFEASVRKQLILNRNRDAVAATAFLPNAVLDRLYRLRQQEREVSQYVVDPFQLASQVKVTEADAKSYYDSHKQTFEQPEKVKLQYAIVTADAIEKQVSVTPEELQQFYQERSQQLQKQEERRASHILIALPPGGATAEQKTKAREKADALLIEARKSPTGFAELAKKNSQDPGSAAEGGDLGFFSRGKMAKPFEDAVFGMKAGDIAGPVETTFGYHIIKLEAVKASEAPSFEALKPKLEEEIRKGKAGRLFAQEVEEFSNLVYDQPETLQPVAEKFKLQLQTSGWITRQGGEMPLLNNDKLLNAVFSDAVLKRNQNTEAVEVSPNMLLSARVIEHEPVKQRPFEEVQPQITQFLTRQKATELAAKEGASLLEKLRKGEDAGVQWSAAQLVTRERRQGLHPEAVQAVFKAGASKLPDYAGLSTPDGRYVLYRVTKVIDVQSVDAEQRKTLAAQLDPLAGQEAFAARLSSLKQKGDVKVDAKKLEKPS